MASGEKLGSEAMRVVTVWAEPMKSWPESVEGTFLGVGFCPRAEVNRGEDGAYGR